MRLFLILLPALALAQAPPDTTQAPAPAKKAAPAATKKSPAATTSTVPGAAKPAAAGTPKPAAAGAGRGATTAAKPAVKPAVAAVKPVVPAPMTTDDEKTIYAIGVSIGQSLKMFNLSPAEVELVKRAISDSAEGKPAVELSEWGPKIQPLAASRAAAGAAKEKATGVEYLTKAATEPGAVKTESGLVYREVKVGEGPSPKASDTVKVHYRGTLIDGTEFDSSYKRNEPAQFPLGGVIKCWTEGVQRMKVGGKSTLACPSDLAYGDQGHPPAIPGGATLVFEVELLEIVAAK